MTREEAINILEESRVRPGKPSGYWTAIDMAIEALEREDKFLYELENNICSEKPNSLTTEYSSDVISRQDAIDELEDLLGESWTEYDAAWHDGVSSAKVVIEALPSADRPKGEYGVKGFTYLDLYQKAEKLLDRGEITIGEYEEMIEP